MPDFQNTTATEDETTFPNGAGMLIGMAFIVIVMVVTLIGALCYTDQWRYRDYLIKWFGESCANITCKICCGCCKPPPRENKDCDCEGCDGDGNCDPLKCNCATCNCPNCPKNFDFHECPQCAEEKRMSEACAYDISETQT
ncbi:hypothetical protein C0J52_21926 [Blattella germanica]|nr:hypothetical protein C0J52_06904 [Blattella germanica]PSN45188.1 hypothetical protein C0J52_21926 [Blattella germanica]